MSSRCSTNRKSKKKVVKQDEELVIKETKPIKEDCEMPSGSITAFFQHLSGDKIANCDSDVQKAEYKNSCPDDTIDMTGWQDSGKKKETNKKGKVSVESSQLIVPQYKDSKHKLTKDHKNKQKHSSDAKKDVQVLDEHNKNNQIANKKKNMKNKLSKNSAITDENSSDIVIEDTSEQTTKEIKNVFSFMMESRHKAIGHNSPGKNLEKPEETEHLDTKYKEKLATRKMLFQNWADLKGRSKRKIEDEELGITIDYKLKKRAKRFKKMLTQVDLNDATNFEKHCKDIEHIQISSGEDSDTLLVKPKRASAVCIFSDSSNSESNITSEYKDKNGKKLLHQSELSSFFGIIDKNKGTSELVDSSVNVHNKDNKSIKNSDQVVELDQLVNENNLTPSTKNKWKMRLRLCISDLDDEAIDNLIDSCVTSKTTTNKKLPIQLIRKHNIVDSDDNHSNNKIDNNEENRHGGSKQNNQRNEMKQDSCVVNVDGDSTDDDLMVITDTNKTKLDTLGKIAPVFLKAIPKPKPDKQMLIARKIFLESGIPDKLRKFQEKQQKLLDKIPPIYPTISHIIVKPNLEQMNKGINFWNLPSVTLSLQTDAKFTPEIFTLKLGMLTSSTQPESIMSNLRDLRKVSNIKEEIKKIKIDNPQYPVFKSFRLFTNAYSKSVIQEQERSTPKKNKNSRKRRSKNKSLLQEEKSQVKMVQHKLWTDIYKPSSCEEMFSNYSSVKSIRKWLLTWLDCNSNGNTKKYKKSDSSDFESTDVDSRESTDLPRNTLILFGPHGSGKTSAVHAVCSELGIIILESNASSKRTGKVLLQQLQQVSQSYELQGVVHDFLTNECEIKVTPKRLRLLLIEDVDIMFEQDESFLSAINQLISTSQLPIILTTTDINCLHLKKLFSRHTVIKFIPVSPKISSPWIQIICLIEGISVSKQFISELLQEYNGDVRCTLLQLQFLIQSLGDTEIATHSIKNICMNNDKEASNMSLITKYEDDNVVCIETHTEVVIGKASDTIKPLDLGRIWWNISQLLNIPSPFQDTSINMVNEIDPKTDSNLNTLKANKQRVSVTSKSDIDVFVQVHNVFDACAMTDLFYTNIVDCDLEPVSKSRTLNLKRSLEEIMSSEDCYFNRDLTLEICHSLVSGYISCRRISNNVELHRGVDEKRWRSKHYKCEEKLLAAVPVTHHLDRMALTDYFSTLRAISKSESVRLQASNKRNNRFYNYLVGLGISVNDSILNTANNAFFSDNPIL